MFISTAFNSIISRFVLLSLSSCMFITGQGQPVTKEMDVEPFSSIELEGSFDVELSQGSVQKVVAHGQENIIDKLRLKVTDNVLHLSLKPGNYRDLKLTVKITVQTIEAIELSGSGDIIIGTFVGLESLHVELDGSGDIRTDGAIGVLKSADIEMDGSGDIKLKLKAKAVVAELEGSGNIDLEGSTADLTVSLDGSGDIRTYGLMAANCKASIGGSGDVKVFASEKLDARIDGSGDIRYKGNPHVTADIDGSGSIKAAE